MCGGCISTGTSPAHEHTAAAVTAQHHLNACHLFVHTQKHGVTNNVSVSLSLLFFHLIQPYLYLLANVLSLRYKAKVVAFGFSWQKAYAVWP